MKVLKVFLFVLTLGFGSTLVEKNFLSASTLKGSPLTIHSILAVNSAIIGVVGDYQYFLKCNKYKIQFERVQKEKEQKINFLYPSCSSIIPAKIC